MARHQSGIVVAFCAAEDQTAYRGRVARKAYGVCVLQAEVGGPAMLGGAFHQNQPHFRIPANAPATQPRWRLSGNAVT
jgi:hypothetical protein